MSHRTLAVAALVAAPILPLAMTGRAEAAPTVVAHVAAPSTVAHRRHVAHLHHLHALHLRAVAAARAAGSARAKILRVAASYAGVPYAYGGSSRSGVDCSGYVDAVMREALHKHLPRTVSGLRAFTRTPRRPQPGDLIFYGSTHTAIVAAVSHGRVSMTWVARHSGTRVQRQRPYAAFTVGAVV